MGYALKVDFQLENTSCCVCGTRFAVDEVIMENRRKSAGSIHCPNGHSIGWSESEAEKLRKQLTAEQSRVAIERSMRLTAENQLAKVQRESKRISKRIQAGVCPHCNRSFAKLAAHMKCKHAEVA